MNLSELSWAVRKALGEEEAEHELDPGDIVDQLNQAYLEILRLDDMPFQTVNARFDTVSGQAVYGTADLTSGTWPDEIDHVAVVSEFRRVLKPERAVTLADIDVDTVTVGATPAVYVPAADDTMTLFPVPDRVETLEVVGRAVPAPLAEDDDTPIFEAEFHPAIVYLAAADLLERRGASWDDEDGAKYAVTAWQQKVDGLRNQAARITDGLIRRHNTAHDDGLIYIGRRPDRARRRGRY